MEKNIRISAVVGIDPGANGGIVVYRPNHLTKAIRMPRELMELKEFFLYMKDVCTPLVFLEKLTVRPDDVSIDNNNPEQARVNMGKMYRIQTMIQNYERLKAILGFCDVPFVMVNPLKWQNDLKLREKIRGRKEDKAARKKRYKDVAQKLYPELDITLWNADATLIMHFGRYVIMNNQDWIKQNLPSNLHSKLF